MRIVNEWFVELNEDEFVVSSLDVGQFIDKAELLSKGKLWFGMDGGPRPWWHRFLGTQKRYVDSLFALEWSSDVAALIFHDENWSEYRALKNEKCASFPEEIRKEISHGEAKAADDMECIEKAMAFKAIREALKKGDRPNWLNYKVVK